MTAPHNLNVDRVFVDASAFIALNNQSDPDHQRVLLLVTELHARSVRLVTTNLAVAEVHALMLRRFNRVAARAVLEGIYESEVMSVIQATELDEQRARQIIGQYSDKDFSFADAVGFAVMERTSITHALSLDRHFAQYGWIVLPPPE